MSAKSSYSAALSLTLKVSWDWFSTKLEEAGWTLTSTISNELKVTVNLEKTFSKSGSLGDYRSPVHIYLYTYSINYILLHNILRV